MERFVSFRYWGYNKKSKPWRSLTWIVEYKRTRKSNLRSGLYIFILLEGFCLFPDFGSNMVADIKKMFLVRQEIVTKKEPDFMEFKNRRTGETKEQGITIDWKEGKMELWKKVEQVFLKEPD
ncbi:hypothetical protein [Clostridium sp. E02]|uniref:hypothetical protein n=1 Tax=Clostridium sp. E02 TaxID=2487134 RepID=UPI000F52E544|nr:hypothetical protein [Clostridium sp. E02]